MSTLLKIDGISKRFRGLLAVDRLSFTVEPGPISHEGRPVQPDYDGPGLDRVTFVRTLAPGQNGLSG